MSTFTPRTGVEPKTEVNFSFHNMGDDWNTFYPQCSRTPDVESDQEERGSVERKESGSSRRLSQSQSQIHRQGEGQQLHRPHHDHLNKAQTPLTTPVPVPVPVLVPPLTPKTTLPSSVVFGVSGGTRTGTGTGTGVVNGVCALFK